MNNIHTLSFSSASMIANVSVNASEIEEGDRRADFEDQKAQCGAKDGE